MFIGRNFRYTIPHLGFDYVALTSDGPSMNCGIFSKKYLLLNKRDLERFKTFNNDPVNLNRLKHELIINEDILLYDKSKSLNKSNRINIGIFDFYGNGSRRLVEYFPDIDLFKIKANWSPKKDYNYNIYLTKQHN